MLMKERGCMFLVVGMCRERVRGARWWGMVCRRGLREEREREMTRKRYGDWKKKKRGMHVF